MSQGNPQAHSRKDWTLGPGLPPTSCLLVERACRDGEDHHRSDCRREGFLRWTTRGLVLLFTRFRRQKQFAAHLSYPSCPTRAQVHRISIDPRPSDPVGSSNRPRVPVWPDGQVDRRAPHPIRHLDSDCHRRLGRMQRRGTRFGDPFRPRAVHIPDPEGQILPHRSTGATNPRRLPSPSVSRSNGRVPPP